MKIERLKKIVEKWKNKKIAVVGDLMLDVYIWGKVSRISQEAPVPIVQVRRKTRSLGGASNVMRNIATLGGKIKAFGVVGTDENGKIVRSLLSEYGIDNTFVLSDTGRNTIEKQRVIAGSQQLLRVDYETAEDIRKEIRWKILEGLIKTIESEEVDAVIFEDYAKGVLNAEMLDKIIQCARKKGVITALDPHPSRSLEVKGLTVITPNRLEAFSLAGKFYRDPIRPVEKDLALINDVAVKLKKIWSPDYLLITLGADGMALFERGKNFVLIHTQAREVFDVSGAGDTVIGSFILALLGGADGIEAAKISNHAAGIVVGKIGTATVSADELVHDFVK